MNVHTVHDWNTQEQTAITPSLTGSAFVARSWITIVVHTFYNWFAGKILNGCKMNTISSPAIFPSGAVKNFIPAHVESIDVYVSLAPNSLPSLQYYYVSDLFTSEAHHETVLPWKRMATTIWASVKSHMSLAR